MLKRTENGPIHDAFQHELTNKMSLEQWVGFRTESTITEGLSNFPRRPVGGRKAWERSVGRCRGQEFPHTGCLMLASVVTFSAQSPCS